MKIKNMKLMLLGLLAMGSMNAFAAIDEESRSVNDVLYLLETNGTNKTATVVGINSLASEANQKTISIPATVAGEHGTYKVVALKSGWEKKVKDVSAVTTSLSIDVTNFTAPLTAADAFNSFTKLEALTITDSNAAKDAKTLVFDGSAASCKATLKTLTISGSNINEIAANGCKGYTALETIELGQIKTIGANAFDGCSKVSSLTVPATVTSIGADAFANMYAEDGDKKTGLQTLVYNAKTEDKTVPAAFAGDKLLKSITIASENAETIAADAFKDAAAVETIDLSGSAKLKTIGAGAFAASDKLKKCLLAGTALTDITTQPALTACAASLEEITFPAGITTLPPFTGFKKLQKVDLSGTKVTAIPDVEFQKCEALAEVKLNAETATIGERAFEGCKALATVANLANAKLTSIGAYAFDGAALAGTLDLSAATNKDFKVIPAYAFANMATLTGIILPKQIEEIATAAFAYDKNVASFNLGELEKVTTLNPIFHEGVVGVDADAKEVAIALTSLTLPSKLKVIEPGALQLLDIEEITIPSSVWYVGERALQGCIYLKTFTWTDCGADDVPYNTFLGTDRLENVYFMGYVDPEDVWLTDDHFLGNDKDVLTVHVTGEVYNFLIAKYNWNENAKYSTLVGETESEIEFTAKNADGYWRTWVLPGWEYDKGWTYTGYTGTWIKAGGAVKVYGAVIEGSNVVLKEYETENGYYKIAPEEAVILFSQEATAKVEFKYLYENQKRSTCAEGGNALDYTWDPDGIAASRLKYQYKLGVKDGQLKFWRVTSGTIKQFVPYLEAEDDRYDREFLDIVFDSEATAIKGINKAGENNGAIYNLQGVRVNKAQKGVYIQNGKKFIVK